MSLEEKIELLTAAVVELTRVMDAQAKPEPAPLETRVADTAFIEVVKEDPNEKSKPTTDTSPPSSNESPTVTYDDVKNITIAMSKIDKAKTVAGLARFGVRTAKSLNESQWPDYMIYMKRIAAGEVAPEAGEQQ